MTREEAIKEITKLIQYGGLVGITCHEALDMAIKALEQEPILDKVKTEIKEWYWQANKQALAKDPCVIDAMIDLFIRIIDKYKKESEDTHDS